MTTPSFHGGATEPHDNVLPGKDAGATAARPFVKWAGGKGQLLPELVARSPRHIDAYYEPFVGGGAMFFALASDPDLAPARAVLNDLNRELITTYAVVRDRVEALIERLEPLAARYLAAEGDERAAIYYAERRAFSAVLRGKDRADGRDGAVLPRTDDVDLAARLLFLNKTCFNGLYRVNRRGEFNVPHGRYARPRILDVDGLLAASRALQRVELRCADFAAAVEGVLPGKDDFVYCDPPFEPLSKTSSFTGYTEGAFGRAEQLRLKHLLDTLTGDGVRVMLSNSPADWLLGVYEGAFRYHIDRTPARRAINSRGDRRSAIDELIVTNYPPEEARGRLESA